MNINHNMDTACTTLPATVAITEVRRVRRRKRVTTYEARAKASCGYVIKPAFRDVVGFGKSPEAAAEDLGRKVLAAVLSEYTYSTTTTTMVVRCDYTGTT